MSKEALKLARVLVEVLVPFEKLFMQADEKDLLGGQNIDCQIATTDLRKLAYAAADLRETLAEQPAQQAPDTHQLFIDSLPTGCDDKMFEQIHHWARQSYQRHKMSVRGQSITAADAPDSHIIWATLRWAKENADPQPSKSWVGLTDFERDQLWYRYSYKDLMIAIEDKLKEKNT